MPQTRREKQAEFARSVITEAAAEVFSRKGFRSATVDEIARTAGYSPAAIYKYFQNKDEVFLEVMRELGERSLEVFAEPVPRSLTFLERVRWLLVRQFTRTEETRELFFSFVAQRLYFEWDLSTEIGERAHEFYRRYLALMTELMAEGIDEGALKPGDPENYALAFVGICNAFVLKWLTAVAPETLEDSIDILLSIFFNGVLQTNTQQDV